MGRGVSSESGEVFWIRVMRVIRVCVIRVMRVIRVCDQSDEGD